MKLTKTIIVNGKLVPAGTDIATEGLDASRIPEAALEAAPKRSKGRKRRKFVNPKYIKPGTVIEYEGTGEKFKVIKASKNFDELKSYDESGIMQEEVKDGYKGWMIAVTGPDGEKSVWAYGSAGLYLEAGTECKHFISVLECAVPAFEAAPADLRVAPETVAKLLPMLKSAYAEEINAWYQYYIIAPFLVGKERTSVVADYAENGNEELKHASMLLERINQLGGDFADIEALDKLDALAKAKYIKPTSTDVAVSLQQVVDAEKGAIETYTALEEASRDIDVVTNRLVKQILEDEQTHLQEALDFLDDIA